jgi:leader peptidase (prepilin peptidase) / N-methyltransferase
MIPAETTSLSAHGLCPKLTTLLGGTAAIAAISTLTLPWHTAIASTTLGAFMVAGADVDARTYLLPDTVTWGAAACGLLAALVLNPSDPAFGIEVAVARAIGTAFVLALLRLSYAYLRGHEGLGLGDVKLSAAVGAWLPLEFIPLCFTFAAIGALIIVGLSGFGSRGISRSTKIPFGAFLCPALWFIFYIFVLLED